MYKYYRAEVYENTICINSYIANSIDVLKDKSKPYINNDKVTQITVSECKDIGYFKVPKEFKDDLKDELL